MENIYTGAIAELGASLASLVVKGTVTAINTKIQAVQAEKDTEKIKNVYDEIVNELISEREEAIRIAQVYKAELERIVISDDDIEHLHATASRLLDMLKTMSPGTDVSSFEAFKDLISVDTLKTMQLLGFNYKAAIGEPLTQICANAISNLGSGKKSPGKNNGKK